MKPTLSLATIHRGYAVMLLLAYATVLPALLERVLTEQAPSPWWLDFGGAVVATAVAAHLLVVAVRGGDPRTGGRLIQAAFLALALAWSVTAPAHVDGRPWPVLLAPVAVGAAAVAWPPRAAVVTVVALTLASAALRLSAGWHGPTAARSQVRPALEDTLYLLALGVAILVAVGTLRATVLALDSGAALATRTVSRAEEVELVHHDRSRWDAMVHDNALAVIDGAAVVRTPEGLGQIAADARRALALLTITPHGEDNSVERLTERVRTITEERAPGCAVHLTCLTSPAERQPSLVPARVADAVADAVAEALRNTRRHAPGARVDVRGRLSATAVEITVRDDGPGFDPATVPASRLGLQLSIHRRLVSVGGTAEWVSTAGGGTSVTVRWTA